MLSLFPGGVVLYSGAALAADQSPFVRVFQAPDTEFNGSIGHDPESSFSPDRDSQMALVPDLDGDGLADVVVSDPRFTDDGNELMTGRVYAFSSATGALMLRIDRPRDLNGDRDVEIQFGALGIVAIGGPPGSGPGAGPDLDGDGTPDLAVSSLAFPIPGGVEGVVQIYSGATGALLRTIGPPADGSNSNFGRSLRVIEDSDGDGIPDLVARRFVSSPDGSRRSILVVFSSGTGAEIFRADPPALGGFGGYLSSAGDLDGDGLPDLFAAAPGATVNGMVNAGEVYALLRRRPPPAYVVSSPLPDDLFAWGDPVNVLWTTEPGAPAGPVRVSLVCQGQPPLVVRTAAVDDGDWGFLLPSAVGSHGGPGAVGGCRAEVASVADPSQRGLSEPFAVIDPARRVTVTQPARTDRVTSGAAFTWRWDPADLPSGSAVDLSILCPDRAEVVAFTNRPNTGARGFVLPSDIGAASGCHAQVASSDDPSVFGRSGAFEIVPVPPSVTIGLPRAATVWQAGTTRGITWTTESASAAVAFRIVLDRPGIAAPMRITVTENDGVYEWAIPSDLAPGTGYRVRLSGQTAEGRRVRDVSDLFEITAPPADETTRAALAASVAAPEALTVDPVSPNPARAHARVRVGVPSRGWVWAEVVDVAGRVVATLANGEQSAGWIDLDLDAGALAAGIYLVRVQTGIEVGTRTLTVVR